MAEPVAWEYRREAFGGTFSTPKGERLEATARPVGIRGLWDGGVMQRPSSSCFTLTSTLPNGGTVQRSFAVRRPYGLRGGPAARRPGI